MFAIYLYADGLIQWTTGDYLNGGINGIGGTAAVIGYQFMLTYPNTMPFYDLPGSNSCSIIHIPSRSNVNIPGLFVFLLAPETEPYFGTYYSYFIKLFIGTYTLYIIIVVPVCEEGDVRLVPVGNVNGSGRVEMCLDREWKIVGDEIWGVEEATVVCRQLGLPTDGQDSLTIL